MGRMTVSDAGGMGRLDWGDPDRPVDLVFLHATGFNALTYRTLLAPLGDRFHAVALDLRGHGSSTLPTDPKRHPSWRIYADDVGGFLRTLDRPVVMAGHSMGATTALLTAERAPDRVRSLVLLDPVILPKRQAAFLRLPGMWRLAMQHPWAVAAIRRRDRFPSRDDAFAAYRGRGSFKGWPDETLRDYVEGGFRPTAEGDVELTCARDWEAANYGAQANDPWSVLKRTRQPVRILKAGRGSTCAVSAADATRFPDASLETLEDANHFFPMTRAEAARAALVEALD